MESSLLQSEWDNFDIMQDFEGTNVNIHKITTYLRQAFPNDEIQVQVQFETFSMLQKFEKKLESEYEIFTPQQRFIDTNDIDYIWREIFQKSIKKKTKDFNKMKFYKVMFKNPIQLTVFYHHYEKRINRIENSYNYYILPYSKTLGVYLKSPYDDKIDSFFITEIIEMKNKLMTYIQTDEEIYMKAKYSKIAVEKLEKKNIKVLILTHFSSALFYSDEFPSSYEMKKQVMKILAYHISVIKFPETYVDNYILQEITKLIYQESKPVISQIQRNCGMPVEVDTEKGAVVVTDYHEVFTDGVDLINKNLEQFKILEVQCNSLVELRKIIQKTEYSSLLKFNYRYRKCLLLFSDPIAEKNSRNIEKLCQQMATCFRQRYRLVVHFVHLFKDTGKLIAETERALQIADKYHLECLTYHKFSNYKNFNKIIIEPKQLGIYAQEFRQKQIKMFLFDFITNKQAISQNFNYSIFQEITLDKPIFYEYNQDDSTISSKQTQPSSRAQSDKTQKSFQQGGIDLFRAKISTEDRSFKAGQISSVLIQKIPFEYPQILNFEQNIPIRRGKRNPALQLLMETEWNRKLRIWRLIVNMSLKLPKIRSYDKIELIVPKLFVVKGQSYNLKKYSEVDTKEVNEFGQGQMGYMCFVNRQSNSFIPLYEVQFVDE